MKHIELLMDIHIVCGKCEDQCKIHAISSFGREIHVKYMLDGMSIKNQAMDERYVVRVIDALQCSIYFEPIELKIHDVMNAGVSGEDIKELAHLLQQDNNLPIVLKSGDGAVISEVQVGEKLVNRHRIVRDGDGEEDVEDNV